MNVQDIGYDPRVRLDETIRKLRESGTRIPSFQSMTEFDADRQIQCINEARRGLSDDTERQRASLLVESLKLWKEIQSERVDRRRVLESIDSSTIESAKVILAAREVTDQLKGMMERVAKLRGGDIIQIADAMRSEIGAEEAANFSETAENVLTQLMSQIEEAKSELDDAVSVAQGESVPGGNDMDNFDPDAEPAPGDGAGEPVGMEGEGGMPGEGGGGESPVQFDGDGVDMAGSRPMKDMSGPEGGAESRQAA